MNIEEWDNKFKPVLNHLNDNASWDGVMFETYGEEEQYVYAQDPLKVWTYVDGEDGSTYLINGRALVNRIGYLICEVPYDDHDFMEIKVIDNSCEMCESNEKESPEGKWCTSCKDEYKESDNE